MTFKSFGDYYSFLSANPNFTGVCVVLYSNGTKLSERNFVNGKKHGKQFGWHDNGQKRREFNFVNSFLLGIQLHDGIIYETKPEDGCTWYIFVKETL